MYCNQIDVSLKPDPFYDSNNFSCILLMIKLFRRQNSPHHFNILINSADHYSYMLKVTLIKISIYSQMLTLQPHESPGLSA